MVNFAQSQRGITGLEPDVFPSEDRGWALYLLVTTIFTLVVIGLFIIYRRYNK